MSSCAHYSVHCLNHYDTFRKYLCDDCGRVYICECDRQMAIAFLPHQTSEAKEYGTLRRFRVHGFAPSLCAQCRGEPEEAHPRAAIWGQKGKIERFYWREIFRTECELAATWLRGKGESVQDINEFQSRFPEVAAQIKKRAKRHWQQRHREQPKYDLSERTEARFLASINIPTAQIEAPYLQVTRGDQKIGKWMAAGNRCLSAEEFASEWLLAEGFRVLRCERRLISCWLGAFLAEVVQDPRDPRQQQCMRGSTRGWSSDKRNTPLISFLLPQDFGSPEYFERRRDAFEARLVQLQGAPRLADAFDELLDSSESLRDYLWANEDEIIAAAREALQVAPPAIVLQCVSWTAESFWERQPGWPDLFVYRGEEFRFVEVKSPHDSLSQEQMRWFEWAVGSEIPCQILRIKRASTSAAV